MGSVGVWRATVCLQSAEFMSTRRQNLTDVDWTADATTSFEVQGDRIKVCIGPPWMRGVHGIDGSIEWEDGRVWIRMETRGPVVSRQPAMEGGHGTQEQAADANNDNDMWEALLTMMTFCQKIREAKSAGCDAFDISIFILTEDDECLYT